MNDPSKLLAVDLGVRCGLAVYGRNGRLESYRSTNFGSARTMKNAVWGILRGVDGLTHIVAEGDRNLAQAWEKAAKKQGLSFEVIGAEAWRPDILLKRQRRSGADAKEAADELAREVIEWSGADRPTSLRHDAAEAILIGLWGVWELGWLDELPV
ncbi:hypothetical protein FIV42_13555 [Persicimonas caeni]|uniref:Pre-16S rRNA-processing nuclease YqgF n=1 Tax=Persicimonas caeni TaxID=2292766 RepID=A0A4Y6PTS2_PERCE|nr:hypothetical protein [Persicimonas caeni]QDG51736.1 hypothetical protein FIV42_13555 [Persicimonas caeni]QED32957.1 hypothetical protein FRD00_13550 [Persicimonas caeni]